MGVGGVGHEIEGGAREVERVQGRVVIELDIVYGDASIGRQHLLLVEDTEVELVGVASDQEHVLAEDVGEARRELHGGAGPGVDDPGEHEPVVRVVPARRVRKNHLQRLAVAVGHESVVLEVPIAHDHALTSPHKSEREEN